MRRLAVAAVVVAVATHAITREPVPAAALALCGGAFVALPAALWRDPALTAAVLGHSASSSSPSRSSPSRSCCCAVAAGEREPRNCGEDCTSSGGRRELSAL